MRPRGFGIDWHVVFRFPGGSTSNVWFRRPGEVERLIASLVSLSLWSDLQVIGHDSMPGQPVGGPDEVSAMIRRHDGGRFALARGAPRTAQFVDESDVSIALDLNFVWLDVKIRVGGAALDRLGLAVLSEGIALVMALHDAWRSHAHLVMARVAPFSDEPFVYPRIRPPRQASRRVDAVVDVLEAAVPEDDTIRHLTADANRLAAAAPPPDVQRSEHGGLVIMRWVDDPREADQVGAAAGRHEQWLSQHIETRPAPGWNERGDQAVSAGVLVERPPWLVNPSTATGYLLWTSDTPDDPTAWSRVRELATAPGELTAIVLVAPTREAALELETPARKAGFARILYRSGSGVLWDPDPPGTWLANEILSTPVREE